MLRLRLSWRVPPPGIPLLVVYYGSLLGLLFASRLRLRLAGDRAVLAVSLLLVIGERIRTDNRPWSLAFRLTVFDVGQGEAMLLESGTCPAPDRHRRCAVRQRQLRHRRPRRLRRRCGRAASGAWTRCC